MAGEIKNHPMDRLADLEAKASKMDRLLAARSKPASAIDPLRCRMVRTQGDDAGDPNDVSYPVQHDGQGCRLPIVFLDVVYDQAAADPVIVTPRSATPQAWVYSPFGWIPRLIDLQAHEQGGIWVVAYVPMLDVEMVDAIVAPDTGTVKMILHGDANDQEFEATYDHMAGTSTAAIGQEAVVELAHGRKLWVIRNKEC